MVNIECLYDKINWSKMMYNESNASPLHQVSLKMFCICEIFTS